MDPLTHCLLGAATARAVVGQRLGRAAMLIGAVGGELPDIDVFLPTDPALPMEWHRHFTHALCCAPLMGMLAALPFMAAARWRTQWKLVFAAATAGAATHGGLDMCTSYGTYWLWPLINRRLAWDIVSIVDPVFTGALIAGVVWALIAQSARPARLALCACLVYLGLGIVQHHRASALQASLAESRVQRLERGRVMPTLANLIVWRSIYESGGRLHADALRIGSPGNARALGGRSLPVARLEDLPFRAGDDPRVAQVFTALREFADGYVAILPEDPRIAGDMRYSLATGEFEPLWGVMIDLAGTRPQVRWVFPGGDRSAALGRIWSDLTGRSNEP